jgi:type IV secretion system protein VirD4
MAAPFIDLAPETYSGVMSNLSEKTKFLSDPQVKASTAKSSFSMDDLVTHKSTVYVVIPTERMDAQKTWLRLIASAAIYSARVRKT